MGSIPVAGAKKTDGFTVGLFGTRTPNPSLRAKRAKNGFASSAQSASSSLARRQAEGYSP
jgi:hypothetical protein